MKGMISFICLLGMLISCGKSTEDKVKDANKNIDDMNSIQSSLSSQGVSIQSGRSNTIDSSESVEWLEEISNQLRTYIGKGEAVMSTSEDDEVFHTDSYKLENYVSNARSLLSKTQSQISYVKNLKIKREQEAIEKLAKDAQLEKDRIAYISKNKSFKEIKKEFETFHFSLSSSSSTLLDNINEYAAKNGMEKTLKEMSGFLTRVKGVNQKFDTISYTEKEEIDLFERTHTTLKRPIVKEDYLLKEQLSNKVLPVVKKLEDKLKNARSGNSEDKEEIYSLYEKFDKATIDYQVGLESYIKSHRYTSSSNLKSFVTSNENRLFMIKSIREDMKKKVSNLGIDLNKEENLGQASGM